MIIKCYETKAPLFARLFVCDDFYAVNFSIFLEVFPKVMLFCIFFDTTNKKFFNCNVGTRLSRFLKFKECVNILSHLFTYSNSSENNAAVKWQKQFKWGWCANKHYYLSGYSTLRLHNSAVNRMWAS